MEKKPINNDDDGGKKRAIHEQQRPHSSRSSSTTTAKSKSNITDVNAGVLSSERHVKGRKLPKTTTPTPRSNSQKKPISSRETGRKTTTAVTPHLPNCSSTFQSCALLPVFNLDDDDDHYESKRNGNAYDICSKSGENDSVEDEEAAMSGLKNPVKWKSELAQTSTNISSRSAPILIKPITSNPKGNNNNNNVMNNHVCGEPHVDAKTKAKLSTAMVRKDLLTHDNNYLPQHHRQQNFDRLPTEVAAKHKKQKTLQQQQGKDWMLPRVLTSKVDIWGCDCNATDSTKGLVLPKWTLFLEPLCRNGMKDFLGYEVLYYHPVDKEAHLELMKYVYGTTVLKPFMGDSDVKNDTLSVYTGFFIIVIDDPEKATIKDLAPSFTKKGKQLLVSNTIMKFMIESASTTRGNCDDVPKAPTKFFTDSNTGNNVTTKKTSSSIFPLLSLRSKKTPHQTISDDQAVGLLSKTSPHANDSAMCGVNGNGNSNGKVNALKNTDKNFESDEEGTVSQNFKAR